MTTRRECDWRAALEWLKRRRRDDWGDNIKQELSGEIALIQDAENGLADRLAAMIERRRAAANSVDAGDLQAVCGR